MADMVTTLSCDSRHWSGRSCPRWHTHNLCHRGVTTHTIIIIQICILAFLCANAVFWPFFCCKIMAGDHSYHHHHPILYLGFLEQMKILLANQICGTNLFCPHRELLQQSCLQLMGASACPHHQCLITQSWIAINWLTRYDKNPVDQVW